jgi:hypothetical protein
VDFGQRTYVDSRRNDVHDMIASGIGFLEHEESTWELQPDQIYPVYISEPLVVLSLSSLFEQQSWTNRQEGMIRSLRNSPNTASRGYAFEEVALVVLMEAFGGKVQTPFGSLPM